MYDPNNSSIGIRNFAFGFKIKVSLCRLLYVEYYILNFTVTLFSFLPYSGLVSLPGRSTENKKLGITDEEKTLMFGSILA